MNLSGRLLLFFTGFIVLFSCVSHKKSTLFQNTTTSINDTLHNYKFIYKIQPKDVLYISITSFNQKTTDFFNMKTSDKSDDPVGVGYKVSDEGFIVIPILDSVMVKGLTIMETQQKVATLMHDYISDSYVLVELANFTVSILGDVRSPGVKPILKENTSIVEVLSAAGDFGDLANRKNVKVIRTIEGKSTVTILDFLDIKVIESPVYYVMPNDIIYVESLKAKIARSNLSQVTVFVSLISLLVSLITLSRVL
ncbi:MAG: polysaccharide biosynthesis/export family protein [Cytophagales bacterium]|nr:polysaccharide biosynthesis/export family protein [Cytophaga sp.]